MNIATIKAALFAWANGNSSGATVVWADQAAPRPARPYVTLKLNGPYHVSGQDEQRLTTTPGTVQIVGNRRAVLSVQVMGASIMQTAQTLNFSLSKPSVLDALRVAGIAVTFEGNLLNLTSYLETKFEEHFTFDVDLMAIATSTDTVGYMTDVQISGMGETQIIEG
jgi:hypothetical protein